MFAEKMSAQNAIWKCNLLGWTSSRMPYPFDFIIWLLKQASNLVGFFVNMGLTASTVTDFLIYFY